MAVGRSGAAGGTDDAPAGSRLHLAAGLLLVGGLLLALTPLLTVMNADDGSSTSPSVGSGWLAAFPAVLVVALSALRRPAALPAVVGVGIFGLVRLVTDLGIVFDPAHALRPELYGVRNLSAFPLHPTWAAWIPVVSDVCVLAGGAIAGSVLVESLEPPARRLAVADWGREVGVVAEREPRSRVMPMTPAAFVGVVGATGYLTSTLGVNYAKPLPAVRDGFADIGLWGTVISVVTGLLMVITVMTATALTPALARGLLLGVAAAAATPPLIVIVGSVGPNATASGLAYAGLISAVVFAAAGLSRSTLQPEPTVQDGDVEQTSEPKPPTRKQFRALASVTLAAAMACLLAFLLRVAGFDDGRLPEFFDPARVAFLPAAVLLAVAAILIWLPSTSRWGRAAVTLAWAPALVAVLFGLHFVLASTPPALFLGNVFTAETSLKLGFWCGLAGLLVAIGCAIWAGVLTNAETELSAQIIDVDYESRSVWATPLAAVISVLSVVSFAMPVWKYVDTSASALFSSGGRPDTWGMWVSVVAVICAVVFALRAGRRSVTLTLFVAAAAVVLSRLIVAPSITRLDQFRVLPGFWVAAALGLVLLVAGGIAYRRIGPPVFLDPVSLQPLPAGAVMLNIANEKTVQHSATPRNRQPSKLATRGPATTSRKKKGPTVR
ncbi:hypothetical protein EH165_11215 [Nakamurella antarctica]|uniref:Uncharacterized protein n=1 Tax=Nakamurella antarctica TaxID=1902245 RepID=A0A3G8ZP84_9ACTN|nr:hypothetical protein [Nakamurella antarctica]AZI58617.1 hypothetical protein EH165_11215 [Nakamurella antarctica]